MRSAFSILSLILVFTAIELPAQEVLFQLDKHHSSLSFEVAYLGLMKQSGNFNQFDVVVSYDSSQAVPLRSVTMVVQMKSIDTNNRIRDRHLRSPDFLDVESYPQAIFQSTKIEALSNGEFKIDGELLLKGISKQIALVIRQTYGVTSDRGKNLRVGFEGSIDLNRTEFGIIGGNEHNGRFDLKTQVIGEQLSLSFSIQSLRAYYSDWEPALKLLKEYEQVEYAVFMSRYEAFIKKISEENIDLTGEEQLQFAAFTELARILSGRGKYGETMTLLSGIRDFSSPMMQRAIPLILEASSRSGTRAELERKIAQVLRHIPAHATALELMRN